MSFFPTTRTQRSPRRRRRAAVQSTAWPGSPTFIFNVKNQDDLTANEYNSLQDESVNGYNAAYVSGGKASKSAALQLDGNDTLLTQNNGFNDGSLYRTAAGVLLNAQVFPTGVGTVMVVAAVKAFKHLFGSADFVVGGGSNVFRPLGFKNGTNLPAGQSNGIEAAGIAAPTTGVFYVYTSRFNATNMRFQRDNDAVVTTAGDARVGLAQPLQFFFNAGDAGCFEGYFAMAICWPEALSDADVLQAKTRILEEFPTGLGI